MDNRRSKPPNVKASWIREGDVRKLLSRKEQSEEWKGAREIEPKNENQNVISQGVDEGKETETWNLEGEHRRKRRDHQKRETEKVHEKKALGGRKEQNISLTLQEQLLCVTDSKTCPKKRQNCRENGVICHNLEAKHQTHQSEKRKIIKRARQRKSTKILKTSTTGKPEGPNCQELGFQKWMFEKYVQRKAAKMKKSENNQTQGNMEEKISLECSL